MEKKLKLIDYPGLVREWHPHKNKRVSIYDLTDGSDKLVHWICSECHHEWRTQVKSRTKKKLGVLSVKSAGTRLFQS